MRIALYLSPLATGDRITGVIKHALGVAQGLRNRPDVSLELLASRSNNGEKLAPSLSGLAINGYPGSEAMMRRFQLCTSAMPIDRWAAGADWIYCPKEQPVAVGRARLAVTVHDVAHFEGPIPGWPRRKSLRAVLGWRFAMSRLLSRAHLVATVSQFTRDRLIELFHVTDTKRVAVIGNGVDAVYFRQCGDRDAEVLAHYGVSAGNFALAVGGLSYRKGGDILLDLGEQLTRSKSDMTLLVCGLSHDAPLLARLRELERSHAGFPVRMAGYAPDEDLAALYRNCSALVFPSRYEGFGIPMLEAMACGAPVICANTSALPETAGDAAFVLPQLNADALMDALTQLRDSSALRPRLIQAGRQRAAEHTWDRCADRLVSAMKTA